VQNVSLFRAEYKPQEGDYATGFFAPMTETQGIFLGDTVSHLCRVDLANVVCLGQAFSGPDAHSQLLVMTAQAAQCAYAAMPTQEARLNRAVDIVLRGDVTLINSVTASVQSCAGTDRRYTVVGSDCDCPDAQRPGVICKHRLSVRLVRKIQESLLERQREEEAVMQTPQENTGQPGERKITADLTIHIGPNQILITLEDTSDARLAERLEWLCARYGKPVPPRTAV
jgi:hypothetical protein